jgi:hypothetical protein
MSVWDTVVENLAVAEVSQDIPPPPKKLEMS